MFEESSLKLKKQGFESYGGTYIYKNVSWKTVLCEGIYTVFINERDGLR